MSDREILGEFVLPKRLERLEEVARARTNELTIVLDRIRNEHNISAVLRSADAFGINAVHILSERFQYSSGITLGAEQWLELHHYNNAASLTEALRSAFY